MWDLVGDTLVVVSVHQNRSRLAMWYVQAVRAIGSGRGTRTAPGCRCYIFYGLALCASLIALRTKSRLLIYKLRRRRSPTFSLVRTTIGDLEERLDIHKQQTTKAVIYLLTACCEVRRRLQLA